LVGTIWWWCVDVSGLSTLDYGRVKGIPIPTIDNEDIDFHRRERDPTGDTG